MEGQDRQSLIPVFKRTGAALQVVGDAVKNQRVVDTAKAVQAISTGMDGTEIVQRTTALTEALQKAVPGVKPSPKLELVPPEAEAEAPPAQPGRNGKASPRDQSKTAAPAPEPDDAQTASEQERPPAPAGANPPPATNGKAPAPAPAPPPRGPDRPAPAPPAR
jgi:hypothetical protein